MANAHRGPNRSVSFWKRNSLTLSLLAIFLLSWVGQWLTGHKVFNEELVEHGQPTISVWRYFFSGHFLEATFENWESEFLQMAAMVLMTAYLYQWGSAESNPLPGEKHGTIEKRFVARYFVNHKILRGIYEYSLTIALGLLFLFSFLLHLYGGWKEELHKITIGESQAAPMTMPQFLGTSEFWFQSFQNWQSEFMSVAALVVLSIFLRQKDSSQSKDVDAPHWQTA
jgi:hypothetical protein